jgi:V8-like Glu-specific endopeptidase
VPSRRLYSTVKHEDHSLTSMKLRMTMRNFAVIGLAALTALTVNISNVQCAQLSTGETYQISIESNYSHGNALPFLNQVPLLFVTYSSRNLRFLPAERLLYYGSRVETDVPSMNISDQSMAKRLRFQPLSQNRDDFLLHIGLVGQRERRRMVVSSRLSAPPYTSIGLLLSPQNGVCCATLVAPNVLLTASHCMSKSGQMVGERNVRAEFKQGGGLSDSKFQTAYLVYDGINLKDGDKFGDLRLNNVDDNDFAFLVLDNPSPIKPEDIPNVLDDVSVSQVINMSRTARNVFLSQFSPDLGRILNVRTDLNLYEHRRDLNEDPTCVLHRADRELPTNVHTSCRFRGGASGCPLIYETDPPINGKRFSVAAIGGQDDYEFSDKFDERQRNLLQTLTRVGHVRRTVIRECWEMNRCTDGRQLQIPNEPRRR